MRLKCLLAVASFVLAPGAFAQVSPSVGLVLSPSGDGMLSASFQSSVNGFFLDSFTFTPSALSGEVSVSLMPGSGPINFTTALLNGDGFSFDPDAGSSTFSFHSMANAAQPLALQILGFAGDASTLTAMAETYTGTISVSTVAAVPEPATYALMLAGLGLVGALLQRRQRKEKLPVRSV
jgi:hypothetical protein